MEDDGTTNEEERNDNYVSIPFGVQPISEYLHASKNCDIQAITYNSKLNEYIILDSRGISSWVNSYANNTVNRVLNFEAYKFNVLRDILYCRASNIYFGLSKEYQLKIYNLHFHETFSVESDGTSITCLMYDIKNNELITTGRNKLRFWSITVINNNNNVQELILNREYQVADCSLINNAYFDINQQRIYLLCDYDVWCYSIHGRLIFRIDNASTTYLSTCIYSHTMNLLVIAAISGQIDIFSSTGGKVTTLLNHSNLVTSLILHPNDPSMFFSSSMDGSVKLFSLQTLEELCSISIFPNGVHWMKLHSNKVLYVASPKSIKLLDVNYSFKFWSMVRSPVDNILVVPSRNNKSSHVFVCASDNSLRIYQTKNGHKKCTVLPPPELNLTNHALSIAYDRVGSIVYVLFNDTQLWVYVTKTDPSTRVATWNIETAIKQKTNDIEKNEFGKSIFSQKVEEDQIKCICLSTLNRDVLEIDFPSNNSNGMLNFGFLLCGLSNGSVVFLDPTQNGSMIKLFKAHPTSPILQIIIYYGKEYTHMLTQVKSSSDNIIQIWNLKTFTIQYEILTYTTLSVYSFKKYIFAYGNDTGSIKIVDFDKYSDCKIDLTATITSKEHKKRIFSIDIHESKPFVCSGSEDRFVRVWNLDKCLLAEIELDASLCYASFLDCSMNLILSLKAQLFIIPSYILCYSKDENAMESEDDNESYVYEDFSMQSELEEHTTKSININLSSYLVPYPHLNLDKYWQYRSAIDDLLDMQSEVKGGVTNSHDFDVDSFADTEIYQDTIDSQSVCSEDIEFPNISDSPSFYMSEFHSPRRINSKNEVNGNKTETDDTSQTSVLEIESESFIQLEEINTNKKESSSLIDDIKSLQKLSKINVSSSNNVSIRKQNKKVKKKTKKKNNVQTNKQNAQNIGNAQNDKTFKNSLSSMNISSTLDNLTDKSGQHNQTIDLASTAKINSLEGSSNSSMDKKLSTNQKNKQDKNVISSNKGNHFKTTKKSSKKLLKTQDNMVHLSLPAKRSALSTPNSLTAMALGQFDTSVSASYKNIYDSLLGETNSRSSINLHKPTSLMENKSEINSPLATADIISPENVNTTIDELSTMNLKVDELRCITPGISIQESEDAYSAISSASIHVSKDVNNNTFDHSSPKTQSYITSNKNLHQNKSTPSDSVIHIDPSPKTTTTTTPSDFVIQKDTPPITSFNTTASDFVIQKDTLPISSSKNVEMNNCRNESSNSNILSQKKSSVPFEQIAGYSSVSRIPPNLSQFNNNILQQQSKTKSVKFDTVASSECISFKKISSNASVHQTNTASEYQAYENLKSGENKGEKPSNQRENQSTIMALRAKIRRNSEATKSSSPSLANIKSPQKNVTAENKVNIIKAYSSNISVSIEFRNEHDNTVEQVYKQNIMNPTSNEIYSSINPSKSDTILMKEAMAEKKLSLKGVTRSVSNPAISSDSEETVTQNDTKVHVMKFIVGAFNKPKPSKAPVKTKAIEKQNKYFTENVSLPNFDINSDILPTKDDKDELCSPLLVRNDSTVTSQSIHHVSSSSEPLNHNNSNISSQSIFEKLSKQSIISNIHNHKAFTNQQQKRKNGNSMNKNSCSFITPRNSLTSLDNQQVIKVNIESLSHTASDCISDVEDSRKQQNLIERNSFLYDKLLKHKQKKVRNHQRKMSQVKIRKSEIDINLTDTSDYNFNPIMELSRSSCRSKSSRLSVKNSPIQEYYSNSSGYQTILSNYSEESYNRVPINQSNKKTFNCERNIISGNSKESYASKITDLEQKLSGQTYRFHCNKTSEQVLNEQIQLEYLKGRQHGINKLPLPKSSVSIPKQHGLQHLLEQRRAISPVQTTKKKFRYRTVTN